MGGGQKSHFLVLTAVVWPFRHTDPVRAKRGFGRGDVSPFGPESSFPTMHHHHHFPQCTTSTEAPGRVPGCSRSSWDAT